MNKEPLDDNQLEAIQRRDHAYLREQNQAVTDRHILVQEVLRLRGENRALRWELDVLNKGGKMLTRKDLTARWGVSQSVMSQGFEPRRVRLGGQIRYRLVDVIEFEDNHLEELSARRAKTVKGED